MLVIHATGDVSLDPTYIPAFRTRGYGYAWSGLGQLFQRDDLTIINHECPSTTIVAPLSKQFAFRCDPQALPVAKAAGVDVISLANNHAYDQGEPGLVQSIRNVRAARLGMVGAGMDAADAVEPLVYDLQGWKVAVLGFDEVIDPDYQVATADKPGTATGHDFAAKIQAIEAAKEAGAELVIVEIHWGVELDTQPRDYQVQEAREMIAAGADMIFGAHSHRLQPLEMINGRPVFFSLGNFVWPAFSAEGSRTGVAQVTVTPKGRFMARLLPATIVSDGHPVLDRTIRS